VALPSSGQATLYFVPPVGAAGNPLAVLNYHVTNRNTNQTSPDAEVVISFACDPGFQVATGTPNTVCA
jgi:hypothetical protein